MQTLPTICFSVYRTMIVLGCTSCTSLIFIIIGFRQTTLIDPQHGSGVNLKHHANSPHTRINDIGMHCTNRETGSATDYLSQTQCSPVPQEILGDPYVA